MLPLRALLCLCFCLVTLACQAEEAEQPHYVFSYFTDNGQDGLHLLHSTDGLQWENVAGGRSLLKPEVGVDKLMRDPAVVRGPDDTYHMVWTVSWGERGIGTSSSKDLIHWTPQRYLPVMEHEPTARNCWAPEAFYDSVSKQFIICWATTIPGRFPETDGQTDKPGYNHRMYCVTTPDFEKFSETQLFYDQGFNVIDATLIRDGERVVMILKDETDKPRKPEKNLRVAFAESALGPYGPPSAPITGNYWAEGPTALQVGEKWLVYFDKYTEHKYGLVTSPDLQTWTDESDRLQMPKGVRHGTAFQVPAKVAKGLLELP